MTRTLGTAVCLGAVLLAGPTTRPVAAQNVAFPGPATGADFRFTAPEQLPARSITTGNLVGSAKGQVWWYRIDVTVAQAYVLRVFTQSVDTLVQLFGPGSPTTRIARDDDGGGGFASRIRAELDAETYWVEISNIGTSSGPFRLDITQEGVVRAATAASARETKMLEGMTARNRRAAWYRLFVPVAGSYEMRTDKHSFDTLLGLYRSGTTRNPIAQDDDGGGGTSSRITSMLSPGEYWVMVSGYQNEVGRFALAVTGPAGGAVEAPPGLESPGIRMAVHHPPGAADVFTSIATAVRSGSFAGLSGLCDPLGESDSLALKLCGSENNDADRREMASFFAAGELVSVTPLNDDSLRGTFADVAAVYGSDTASRVTLRVVQRRNTWHLHSVRDVTPMRSLQVGGPSETIQITRGNEAVWVRLVVPERGRHAIRTLTSGVDTVLELYGPGTMTQRIAQDDDGGGGVASLIQRELAAGTYWIKASILSSGTGEFKIQATRP